MGGNLNLINKPQSFFEISSPLYYLTIKSTLFLCHLYVYSSFFLVSLQSPYCCNVIRFIAFLFYFHLIFFPYLHM